MATDPTIGAPFAYFGSNNQTIVGADVDLADAIGQSLGAPVKVQNTNFDDFIPGLEAGRFDFSVSLMLDTPAREKQVTFVDFIKDGSGFLVAGSSNLTNLTLSDLCGKTAGATAGSVELDDLNKQSSTCTAAGKQPVWVHAFQKQSDGILALSSGRIVAYDGDSDQNAYIAKTSSAQVKVSGQPYGVSIDGIPMPKSSALIQPLQTALQHLMDDGSYGKILSKWGIQNYALTTATINHP